jgi:hypothetical protein
VDHRRHHPPDDLPGVGAGIGQGENTGYTTHVVDAFEASLTFSPTFCCEAGNDWICGASLPLTSSMYVEFVCVGLGRKPFISSHLRPLVTNAGEKARSGSYDRAVPVGANG